MISSRVFVGKGPETHARITVGPARSAGTVPALAYGHFTEHLANVTYDGLWSELVYGRKFETPMVGRREHSMAAPWRPFPEPREGVTFWRGPEPVPRHSPSHGDAHHSQSVAFTTERRTGGECGIAVPDVRVDAGVSYRFRARVRRNGPAERLRVALRTEAGQVLGETTMDLPEIVDTLHGDLTFTVPTLLWMDPRSWMEVSAELRASGTAPDALLTLTVDPPPGSEATVWFDWVSLVPVDAVDGWDARVVAALRDLPVRLLKWPGGCMADDYDWRLGVGPRDRRHCTTDRAWLGWDENDVGTDEFLRLCRLTGAEPYLGVNAGSGTPEVAAAWVEYCNGSTATRWGARRAENGHPQPYGVRYWSVGNELWGHFERGYVGARGYAARYLDFAAAMRAVDPTTRLVAVGQAGEFNRDLLGLAREAIDVLQIHLYSALMASGVGDPTAKILSATAIDDGLAAAAADLEGTGIRVALDEWGWGHGGHAGALFNALVLNAIHRHAPLVELGARSCVVNVDGVVDRAGATVATTDTYEVFRLYNDAHHPVAAECGVEGGDGLDVSALTDPATGAVSVFAVNPSGVPRRVAVGIDVDRVDLLVAGSEGPWGPSRRAVEPASSDVAVPPHSLAVFRSG